VKLGSAVPDIKRDEADGDNCREYCDHQRPIHMPFRATSNGQNGGQCLKPDFAHPVTAPVIRRLVVRFQDSIAIAAAAFATPEKTAGKYLIPEVLK